MIGTGLFLLAAVWDFKTLEVPLWIPLLLFLNRCYFLFTTPAMLWEDIFGMIVCFSIFGISMIFSHIGGADALIAGMIGFYLGLQGLSAILLSLLLCLPYLIWMHWKKREHAYPFIPFLVAGYLIIAI